MDNYKKNSFKNLSILCIKDSEKYLLILSSLMV